MIPCGKDFNSSMFFPKKNLNLGCGHDYREGWVNMDILPDCNPDVIHDFNVYPYPFEDNTFDSAELKRVLEHAIDPIKMLKEVARICKKNARITVIVPHAMTYANLTDIQHKTNFTERSFQKELMEEYQLTDLDLVGYYWIYNNRWKKYLPFKGVLKLFFNSIYDDIGFIFEVWK